VRDGHLAWCTINASHDDPGHGRVGAGWCWCGLSGRIAGLSGDRCSVIDGVSVKGQSAVLAFHTYPIASVIATC